MKHCLVCGSTSEEGEKCPGCNETLVTETEYEALFDELEAAPERLEIPELLRSDPPRKLKKKKTYIEKLSSYIFAFFAALVFFIIITYVIHDLVTGALKKDILEVLIYAAPAFILAFGFLLLIRHVTRRSRSELIEEYILSRGRAVHARVAAKRVTSRHHVLIIRFINEEGRIRSGAIVSQTPFDEKVGDFVLWVYTPGEKGRGLYVDESLLETYALGRNKLEKSS